MKNTIKIAYLFSIFLFFCFPFLSIFSDTLVEEHGNVIRKLDRERKREHDRFFKRKTKPVIGLYKLRKKLRKNFNDEKKKTRRDSKLKILLSKYQGGYILYD